MGEETLLPLECKEGFEVLAEELCEYKLPPLARVTL